MFTEQNFVGFSIGPNEAVFTVKYKKVIFIQLDLLLAINDSNAFFSEEQ